MALLAYGQIFVNGEYLGPAFLGLLFAAAITVMSRRLGIGTAGTIAVSLAGLVWYLVLVFQARHSFYGLPTFEALERIAGAVGRAYDHIDTDYEPVPVRNGYAVMIVVGIWLATVIGEIAAFRWRRPLLASLAPLGLFSIAIVVADREGAPMLVAFFLSSLLVYWWLESFHSLRSWGRWIPTWSDREEEPRPVTARLAYRMGASCVAAALVAPIVLPALDEGVLAWRSGGGDGPGGGGRIDHLVSIKPTLLEQSSVDLFRVHADRPAYWRLVSLAEFDGESWYPGAPPTESVGGGFINAPDVVEAASTTISQDYRITRLEGQFLPAAVAPYTLTFATDDPVEDLERVRSGFPGGELSYEGGIDSELRYSVDSLAPDVTYRTLKGAVPGQGPAAAAYTDLPDDLSPEVSALAREWTRAADGPGRKLIALQQHLRRFTYSTDVEPEDSSDYLVDFLTTTKAGYCQQFATAFAVLARSLGFPARVSVGFLPGETTPATPDSYIVRGTDAHAWPEVAFEGIGWVAFEPTPRSAAPPLTHTVRNALGFIGDTEGTEPGTAGGRTDGPLLRDLGEIPLRDPQSFEARPLTRPRPETPAWVRAFPRFVAVVAALIVVFLVSVPILKSRRARRRFRRAHTPRATAAAAFAQFLDDAGELATPRVASETPRAYAARIAAQRQLGGAEAVHLAALYEAAVYAAWEISRPQADEARKLANRMRVRLWASASWWERAARLFSPAGLRPSAGRL